MLEVFHADGGLERLAPAAGMTVGRGDGCDVKVGGTGVARTHARLEADGGGLVMVCCGSDTSITARGEAVRSVRLEDGIRFRVGDSEFTFAGPPPGEEPGVVVPAGKAKCPACGTLAKVPEVGDTDAAAALMDRLGMPGEAPLTPAPRFWRGGPLVRYLWDRPGAAQPVELDGTAAWYVFFFDLAGAGPPPRADFRPHPRGGLTLDPAEADVAAVGRGWREYREERGDEDGPADPMSAPATPRPMKCGACGRPVVPVAAPGGPTELIPATLGSWEVGAALARGGMGLVLRGHGEEAARPAAVKVRLGGAGGQEDADAERFRREADLLAKVDHPNVVRALDSGTDGGCDFLVLEWVEGRSLKEVIAAHNYNDGPFPAAEAVRWLGQALRGLAAIHGHGIHRDIKPSNLLVDWDGTVKLADLGVARAAGDSGLTTTGAVAGTLAYMAPEQLAGRATDGRSDLFAIGKTFHELLTGQQLMLGEVPTPNVYVRGVPPPVGDLIHRMVSVSPADRPASAEEAAAVIPPDS